MSHFLLKISHFVSQMTHFVLEMSQFASKYVSKKSHFLLNSQKYLNSKYCRHTSLKNYSFNEKITSIYYGKCVVNMPMEVLIYPLCIQRILNFANGS